MSAFPFQIHEIHDGENYTSDGKECQNACIIDIVDDASERESIKEIGRRPAVCETLTRLTVPGPNDPADPIGQPQGGFHGMP
ncbi:hypothetical protein JCM14469_22900 [Desulfatiferula olefinivorans]